MATTKLQHLSKRARCLFPFYPCFPVANQKLHTKCLLRRRRIKKNKYNSLVNRTPQYSFYSAKSTAQIPFQHMLTQFPCLSCLIYLHDGPAWCWDSSKHPRAANEKSIAGSKILPLEFQSAYIPCSLVGWVGLIFFYFSTCLSTCLERRGFLLVEELLLWLLRCLLWWTTFLGVNSERRIIKANRNGNAKRAAARNQIVSLVAKDVKSSCLARKSFKLLCTRSW